jgi:hypothetical protein
MTRGCNRIAAHNFVNWAILLIFINRLDRHPWTPIKLFIFKNTKFFFLFFENKSMSSSSRCFFFAVEKICLPRFGSFNEEICGKFLSRQYQTFAPRHNQTAFEPFSHELRRKFYFKKRERDQNQSKEILLLFCVRHDEVFKLELNGNFDNDDNCEWRLLLRYITSRMCRIRWSIVTYMRRLRKVYESLWNIQIRVQSCLQHSWRVLWYKLSIMCDQRNDKRKDR